MQPFYLIFLNAQLLFAMLMSRFNTNRGGNSYGGDAKGYAPSEQPSHRGGMVPDFPTSGSFGNAGGAVSDGSYERQLVEDLCEPGGEKQRADI